MSIFWNRWFKSEMQDDKQLQQQDNLANIKRTENISKID